MPIDFSKLLTGTAEDTLLPPRQIFSALPAKSKQFNYLRDVQGEVLDQWYDRRTETDLVVKMNTGSGKTTVGLLILKSCLNENQGPAVYLTPDKHLTDQVCHEASALGISLASDEDDVAFRSGKSILVTNVKKLINGKSKFGIKDQGLQISLGSILIDDAHACLALAEEQFTLKLPSTHAAYQELLALFGEDLKGQCEAHWLDISKEVPGVTMLIPYWAWIDKCSAVLEILHKFGGEDEFKFIFPLIKSDLSLCYGLFSSKFLEISPRCLPIDSIPAFRGANRRIYMTATLADDSILVSDFSANSESVEKPISPKSASDMGDRMIIIPQEANPKISDDDIRNAVIGFSSKYNTVVIVPSDKQAEPWKEEAALVLTAANLNEGTGDLRKKHVGLAVLINKYDGVDLPNDACRVLVIDGVPDARRLIDKYEESILMGSELVKARRAHRIEQGMGRGVRAADDYCIVILIGSGTINALYPLTPRKLSPATKGQLELWSELMKQVKNKPLADILELSAHCLSRDPQWVSAMKGKLAAIKYDSEGAIDPTSVSERAAFHQCQIKQFAHASEEFQPAINNCDDKLIKGWLKQYLAEITHHFDRTRAQEIQLSALSLNSSLLKPLQGIAYKKLNAKNLNQASGALDFLKDNYASLNEAVVGLNALSDLLLYRPDEHRSFEAAFMRLGLHMGFQCQRPEEEFNRGPDELWNMGSGHYIICECKSEVMGEKINKHDCDQLNGSINWFQDSYGNDASLIPIIAHRSNIFSYECSPNGGTRIISEDKLAELRRAIREFAAALGSNTNFPNVKDLFSLLVQQSFSMELFSKKYTVGFRRSQ